MFKNMKNNDKNPRNEIVLGIIKNKKDSVLLIKRLWEEQSLDGESKLTWAFPGGEIDEGETEEEALVREIRNETGFKVKLVEKISDRVHPQFNIKITYYSCEIIPGSVKPIMDVNEVESIKWVKISDLAEYLTTDLDPGVAKFLKI
jgi:8-oxo-dGTP diphosphatase